MKFAAAIAIFLGLLQGVSSQGGCANPLKRKEWRALTSAERIAYTTAVNCLQTRLASKAQSIAPGSQTRFEDFIAVHKVQTPNVHMVGHFLPWHRYLMWAYEKSLREECGYTGAQPYWDYTLDSATAQSFRASPIFDPTNGFGGDGSGAQGCVADGPFVGWTIHLPAGAGVNRQERCLSRRIDTNVATQNLLKRFEDEIKRQPDYGHMALRLEDGFPGNMALHGGGHFAIGGSAGDVHTSNTEPLFYLHHTNIDRIWAQWQGRDQNRLNDISFTIAPRVPFLNPRPSQPGNVTLDFRIDLGPLGESVPVRDVMDTKNGILCYEYV